jgi:Ran GTPase-activating protein (RanGAP) involved in mRNA processing and transport
LESNSLKIIRLKTVHTKDSLAADFISSLRSITQLQVLDLRVNAIGMEACQSLAALLRNPDSKLETLLLGSNNIGDAEAEVLAESVCSNNVLTTLAITNLQRYLDTLSHNSLTEIGWGAISKVL